MREFVCEVTVSTRDGHRDVLRQVDSGGRRLKVFTQGERAMRNSTPTGLWISTFKLSVMESRILMDVVVSMKLQPFSLCRDLFVVCQVSMPLDTARKVARTIERDEHRGTSKFEA